MVLSEDIMATTTVLPDIFSHNHSIGMMVVPTLKNLHEPECGVAIQAVWTLIDILLFLAITGGNALTITAILRR